MTPLYSILHSGANKVHAVHILDAIVWELRTREYPIRESNYEAWVLGEEATYRPLQTMYKEGLILAIRPIPRGYGGTDYIAILQNGEFVIAEAKNYRPYLITPACFEDKVLGRFSTTETAIRKVMPNATIHRVLSGSINLSMRAQYLAKKAKIALSLVAGKIESIAGLTQGIQTITRSIKSHLVDWLNRPSMVSRTTNIVHRSDRPKSTYWPVLWWVDGHARVNPDGGGGLHAYPRPTSSPMSLPCSNCQPMGLNFILPPLSVDVDNHGG